MDTRREPYQQRFDDLKNIYNQWRPIHQKLQKFILPTRGFFEDDSPNQKMKLDYKSMVDGEPQLAASIFASGMQSGMTSQASQWFEVTTIDQDLAKWKPAQEWFETVRDILMAIFARSNIYQDFYSIYEELGTFGIACMSIHEDFKNVIRSEFHTVGEYFLGVNEYGMVNTFCRYRWITVENMVRFFGRENVSQAVRNLWDRNQLYEYVKCCQIVEPNDGRDPTFKNNKNMAYRSIYWEDGGNKLLKYSGYEEFPFMAPRWGVRMTSEAYGIGAPGWKILGDSQTLQEMSKSEMAGIAKAADPPLQVWGDINGGIINSLPGGKNHFKANDKAGVSSLYDGNFLQGLAALDASIQGKQQKINRFYYTDLFKMLNSQDRPQMTAREVAERHEEKLTVLSPVLDRDEKEHLDPVVERTFAIATRAGIIPTPPQELEGQELKIDYISTLAQAQKMIKTAAIEQFTAFAGTVLQYQPEILDVIDLDMVVTDYGDKVGISPKYIRSEEQIAAIRQQRAEAMQQQQQMAQAGAMVQGARDLSQINTGENNALTALLGGGLGG
jgi:hypothetical protein